MSYLKDSDQKVKLLKTIDNEKLAKSFKYILSSRINHQKELEEELNQLREKYGLPLEDLTPKRDIVIGQLKICLLPLIQGEEIEKVKKVFQIGIDLPEGIKSISFGEVFPEYLQ
jgi:hypothetical protein